MSRMSALIRASRPTRRSPTAAGDLDVGRIGRQNGVLMRPTEQERESAIRVLQNGCAAGLLSDETFEDRLAHALITKSAVELRQLTIDLKPPPRLRTWLTRLMTPEERSLVSDAAVLYLSDVATRPFVVGRHRRSDLVITKDTVSRRHLQIARFHGGYVLTDLESKNGTWLNGRRVTGLVAVMSGDVALVGDARLRLL